MELYFHLPPPWGNFLRAVQFKTPWGGWIGATLFLEEGEGQGAASWASGAGKQGHDTFPEDSTFRDFTFLSSSKPVPALTPDLTKSRVFFRKRKAFLAQRLAVN